MFEWLRERWESFRSEYWARWTPVERATFAAVAAVVAILLVAVLIVPAVVNRSVGMTPLATNLPPEDVRDIESYLNRNGIDYQLSNNNTAVLVAQKDLYRAKYDIGSGIVLSGGRKGSKIFEEPRLGITDQYFKEQRLMARQVDLERTIRAGSPMIENVFVHLNIPEERLFKREERLATATVKVITRGKLDLENVQAIQTVVAFAVDGLEPERVQVVDEKMRILSGFREQDPLAQLTDAQLQKTRQFEREREEKALAVLEKIAPRASVKVTAELTFNQVDSTKTTFDPEPVLRSERTETESTTEAPAGAGVPGTAANVPGAAVSTGQGTVTTREFEKVETNNEIGQTVETRRIRDFEVKRMTVAVLIDGATENLEAIATLVKNTVGYDAERDGSEGFTLASIAFDTSEEESLRQQLHQQRKWDLWMAGVYSVVVLVVILAMVGAVAYVLRKRVHAHQRMMEEEKGLLRERERVLHKHEFTLDELGIAEVGDISQLPEEEQRKIKIKQKVDEFAKENPEQFASIVRSWLHD